MRPFLIVVWGAFLWLAAATVFGTAGSTDAARTYFTTEEIANGRNFATERRSLFWLATLAKLAWLSVFLAAPVFRRWRTAVATRVGSRWWLALLVIGAVFLAGQEIIQFIAGWVRLEHSRAWEMTSRSFVDWLGEYLIAGSVRWLLEAFLIVGLYGLIRRWPESFWMPAAGLSALCAVVFAMLLPVVIDPLFNTFTPLGETEWRNLEPRFREVAAKAGVPVSEFLVADRSRQGKHTNAYFTGFGATRRIVLYDTLLKSHPPEESESILAHEAGHWQHDHIRQGIAMGTLGALAGFFLLAWTLNSRLGQKLSGARAPGDPVGLPFVAMLLMLGQWLAAPIENAVSRSFERQADAASLELTRNPDAFIGAEVRLVRDNLMDLTVSPWQVWLFGSHPAPLQRIETARSFPLLKE